MDKVISAGTAIVLTLCVLALVYVLSGGFRGEEPRSLEAGLAWCGGPLGLWGAVAGLVGLAVGTYVLHEVFNALAGQAWVMYQKNRGADAETLRVRIARLPLSRGLKRRMIAGLSKPPA
jgi:hypothetical protein